MRGLDTYIFADSQLNYRFDVRLPYSEPSGLAREPKNIIKIVQEWRKSQGLPLFKDSWGIE